MKLLHYRLKIISAIVLLIFVVIYCAHNQHYKSVEQERLERILPLLRADLNRVTEHPVVAGFKRKNSEQDGGLTLINYGETFLKPDYKYKYVEEIFFRYLEKKDVICSNDVRLGNQHEGGWNVCMSPPFKLNEPCLVYSFGIGGDWRFEDDVYDFYRCNVLAFDPSMGIKQHNRTDLISFKPFGLGGSTERMPNGWQMKSFRQHITDEGHLKSVIDYVKFDIEYSEWEVLKSLTKDSILRYVKQLAFEIHLLPVPLSYENDRQILREDFVEKFEILKSLEDIGFKKFNYRLNPLCSYVSEKTGVIRSKCYDLHYMNMDYVETEHLEQVEATLH